MPESDCSERKLTDGSGVWRRPLHTKVQNFERPVADLEVGTDSQKIGRFLRIFLKLLMSCQIN